MTKYSVLDAAILASLTETPNQIFAVLFTGAVAQECRVLARPDDAFRMLDRRLQFLRKRGFAVYRPATGWVKL